MIFGPKVSIIIPVYNGANYLAEAIESALKQTYRNIEIVVVNDGSNDNGATEKVALSYKNKIKYFSKENGGVGSALNFAIKKTSGSYISWLSHDDLYTKNKIKEQVKYIKKNKLKNTILYSDFSIFTTDSDKTTEARINPVETKHFRYWLTINNSLHGCTLLIPRKAFDECGLFSESLKTTQDYDLWFKMATKFTFLHQPQIYVKARIHELQGTRAMGAVTIKECEELLYRFLENLSRQEIMMGAGKPLPEAYQEIADSMFIRGFDKTGNFALDLKSKCLGSVSS